MFVDASAIIGILAEEEGWMELLARIDLAQSVYVSPLSLWESAQGLSRKRQWTIDESETLVRRFIERFPATIIVIDDQMGRAALQASHRFGKGRHPAGLNFGDCFAYACASILGVPLLAKGEDFPKTDIELA